MNKLAISFLISLSILPYSVTTILQKKGITICKWGSNKSQRFRYIVRDFRIISLLSSTLVISIFTCRTKGSILWRKFDLQKVMRVIIMSKHIIVDFWRAEYSRNIYNIGSIYSDSNYNPQCLITFSISLSTFSLRSSI